MSMKDKPIVTANWNVEAARIFCEICVEESEAGNAPHGSLSNKGYLNAAEKFKARTERPYTPKQLKNRWDNLKSLYDFWLACLHDTGLGWDEKLKTVTASQNWWDNNAKGVERKAIQFGPPNNLDLLDKMFDKKKVYGVTSCIPGEEAKTATIDVDVEEEIVDDSKKKGSTKEEASKSLKRKARTHNNPGGRAKNPMVRIMKTMVEDVVSSNSITSQALQGDFTRNDIKEVMKLAKEAGAVEGSDEHYMATKLFVKSENRDIFLTFETNEERLNWLKRNFEDKKK